MLKSWLIKGAIGFLLGVVLTVAGVYGYFTFFETGASRQKKGGMARAKQQAKGKPVNVKVCQAKAQGMERTVTRPASVHSFEFARIFAHAAGYLQNQKVDIGSKVKKGELLGEIYAPELAADVFQYKAEHDKAQADVEVKKAMVASAKSKLNEAEAQLEETKADVESAKADLELKRRQYVRIRNLAKLKAIEQELVDEKEAAKLSADAKVRAVEKSVVRVQAAIVEEKANVKKAKADLVDAKAQVEVALGKLKRAKALLEYTKVEAPFDGIITFRGYHNGDFIHNASQAGGDGRAMFVVNKTNKMRVVVRVPANFVPYVEEGRRAELIVDDLPNHVFKGKIARSADSEDYITRTMRTEVDFENKDKDYVLKDGMYGKITLYLGRGKGKTIPADALTKGKKKDQNAIYVRRGKKAKKINVKVIQDDGKMAAVESDELKDDDEIVWEHGPGIEDGSQLNVVHQGWPSYGEESKSGKSSSPSTATSKVSKTNGSSR